MTEICIDSVESMELNTFLRRASKRERAELAVVCSNSVLHLYQLAGNHRKASPVMATKIEHISRQVAAESNGRLELVPRETLVRNPEIFHGLITRDSQ